MSTAEAEVDRSSLLLAVKLHMYQDAGPLDRRFAQLRSVGADGVEVGLDATTAVDEVARASRSTGLSVPTVIANGTFAHSVTSPDAAEGRAGADAVLQAVDAAATIGADVVMLNPGWRDAEASAADTAALARERLEPAVTHAAAAGVALAVENLWNGWLDSGAQLASFVDSFPQQRMRVLFDTGNAERFSPAQGWVEALGTRIVRIDVKDYARAWADRPASVYAKDADLRAVWGPDGPWGALDALPFEGDVAWPRVAESLAAGGYDGWCCAEHGSGDLTWIAAVIARLRRFSALCQEASRGAAHAEQG